MNKRSVCTLAVFFSIAIVGTANAMKRDIIKKQRNADRRQKKRMRLEKRVASALNKYNAHEEIKNDILGNHFYLLYRKTLHHFGCREDKELKKTKDIEEFYQEKILPESWQRIYEFAADKKLNNFLWSDFEKFSAFYGNNNLKSAKTQMEKNQNLLDKLNMLPEPKYKHCTFHYLPKVPGVMRKCLKTVIHSDHIEYKTLRNKEKQKKD